MTGTAMKRMPLTNWRSLYLYFLQSFLLLQRFRSGEQIAACHLVAMVVGKPDVGKTTFIASTAAANDGDSRHLDSGGQSNERKPTEGMEMSIFTDALGQFIHFVDYAGQAEFALTHDLFSERVPTPTIAFVLINANLPQGEIEKNIEEAAAVLIGRYKPSSDDG